jgi:hypothetical protein
LFVCIGEREKELHPLGQPGPSGVNRLVVVLSNVISCMSK